MREMRKAYKILVGKPGGKRPLERSSPTCDDNIELDLEEVVCDNVDWIYLAHSDGLL
jgi:hypothetical protein